MAIQLFDEQANTEPSGLVSWGIAYKCDTRSETIGSFPDPGLGLPENWGKRRIKRWPGGGYIVNCMFEGLTSLGTPPDTTDAGFYPSFKEAKLVTHPRFQQILTKYGGTYDPYSGVITWTPTTSGGGSAGPFGSASAAPNPMFGQDSYVEVAVLFRYTRIYQSAPAAALKGFARIVSQLPAEAGGIETPVGRNWFIMPPTVVRRGNVWTDSEEWMLSPPGQLWNPDIYDFIVG